MEKFYTLDDSKIVKQKSCSFPAEFVYKLPHDKTNKKFYVPSEDSDSLGIHPV